MRIRALEENDRDIGALTRLMNQWDDIPAEITRDYISAKVEKIRSVANSEIFLAELPDSSIDGYALVLEVVFLGMDPYIELQSILVDSAGRRKGTGRALIAHAEAWSRERGFGKIVLSSRVQLTGPHEFYKSLGYGIFKQSYFFSKNL